MLFLFGAPYPKNLLNVHCHCTKHQLRSQQNITAAGLSDAPMHQAILTAAWDVCVGCRARVLQQSAGCQLDPWAGFEGFIYGRVRGRVRKLLNSGLCLCGCCLAQAGPEL